MKRTLLAVALLAASGAASAGDYYNGRLSGMAGAGYASAKYADGAVYNPSLAAGFDGRDDLALVINGGAMGEDEDQLFDRLEALRDYLEELEQRTDSDWYEMADPNDPYASGRAVLKAEAEEAIRRLEAVSDRTANVGVGGNFALALPSDTLSLAVIGKTRAEASVTAVVDKRDYDSIRDFVGRRDFDPGELRSHGIGRGAIVSEVGVAVARSLESGDTARLLVGVTPKWVSVSSFVYTATVDSFDENGFDSDEYTVKSNDFNLDVGATYVQGNLRYALTVANLKEAEYDTVVPGYTVKIEPRTTAAVAYKNNWLTAELASDLYASPNFVTGQDTQIARAGVEVDLASWIQFRAGLQQDLKENVADLVSVGLGFSPFDVVNIDLAVFSENLSTISDVERLNTGGASLQLGVRF